MKNCNNLIIIVVINSYMMLLSICNMVLNRQVMEFSFGFYSVFRSGSTIATYEVKAPSINDKEIENVTTGIFSELSNSYSMIYEGKTV